MLIYILLFYLFRNTPSTIVDASPILNFTSNSTSSFPVSFVSIVTRQSDSSMAGTCNCNQRSTLDIVWSCIATLFLCTWSSIHPNMPAPKDEWWRILWRRLKSMYWALIGPELVLTWAMRQWMDARDILKDYRKLPGQPKWTKKHAQFLQMGGFHLRELEGDKTSLLGPKKLLKLLKEKKISVLSIEERDIEDKSKADALTKIVVILQTLWFVIQCVGRHAQGLALAQLEVATLAVISCTFILCVIWWDKPFDAQQPIYLDLLRKSESPSIAAQSNKTNTSQRDVLAGGSMEKPRLADHTLLNPAENVEPPPDIDDTKIQRDESIGDMAIHSLPPEISRPVDTPPEETKLGQTCDTDKSSKMPVLIESLSARIFNTVSSVYHVACSTIYSFCQAVHNTVSSIYITICKEAKEANTDIVLRVLEICLGWPMIYPISDLLRGNNSKQERVGSYNSYSDTAFFKIIFLPALSAALFGMVHCISWESEFPSATERVLWRISAVGVGSLLAVSGLLLKFQYETSNDVLEIFAIIAVNAVFAAYILARYYLLIEALLSLRALPPSAFQTIEWSDFLPHM